MNLNQILSKLISFETISETSNDEIASFIINFLNSYGIKSEKIKGDPGRFNIHSIIGHKGPHSYSVSGRVKNPGVKLAPAGITMNELLNEYCGGMLDDHNFLGYLPGGASGGILPASMADIPLDFGSLEKHGCFIGSGAIVVFSDKDDVKKVALNLLKFFNDESCGQCTPCRVGTEKAVKLLEKNNWDKDLLEELVQTMGDASICGLGQAAGNPITCTLKYFKDHI